MNWFHASPNPNLDTIGIDPRAEPLVSYRVQGWVYFGSWEYLFDQYFKYAPKRIYYIYEVDIKDLLVDDKPIGEQIRTAEFVNPDRVKLVKVRKPSGGRY